MYMPLHVNTYCVSLNDQIMALIALRDKKLAQYSRVPPIKEFPRVDECTNGL